MSAWTCPDPRQNPCSNSAAQADIQGNIIPGFNKDHQHFLFLRICKPRNAKAFLRDNPDLADELEDKIRAELGLKPIAVPEPEKAEAAAE